MTRPFYLGTYPVTQEQFAVWTREAGIAHANHFEDRPEHPAENLDWQQAMAFCAWLNTARRGELPTGHMAMLPTEAEWEYACRAGTDTEYHTGDGEAALVEAGWFGEDWGSGSTHPVGRKRANTWGLHDMHGNVWEWCADAWDADGYRTRVDGVADPGDAVRWRVLQGEVAVSVSEGEASNPDRVFRGGSWNSIPRYCRAAFRDWDRPGNRFLFRGFRVCLVPGPATEETSGAEPRLAAGERPEEAGLASDAEPHSAPAGDGARRDAAAESEGAPDLRSSRFPRRRDLSASM